MGTNVSFFYFIFFVSNIADLFDNRGGVVRVYAPAFSTLTSLLTVAFKREPKKMLNFKPSVAYFRSCFGTFCKT